MIKSREVLEIQNSSNHGKMLVSIYLFFQLDNYFKNFLIAMMMIMIIIYKNIMIFLTPLNNYFRNKKYDRSLGGEGGEGTYIVFCTSKMQV